MAETEREMAERHVRESAARIERQRELIDDMRVAGSLKAADLAELLLTTYLTIHAKCVERLHRISPEG
jgi:hypothetical protein